MWETPTEPGQRGPTRNLRQEEEDLNQEEEGGARAEEEPGHQLQAEASEEASHQGAPRTKGGQREVPRRAQGDTRTGDRRPADS